MTGRNLLLLMGVCVSLPPIFAIGAIQLREIKTPIRVRSVDVAPLDGALVSLSLDGGLRIEVDGEPREFSTTDVISISRIDGEIRSNGRDVWSQFSGRDGIGLELVGGDRVFGRLGESQPESITVVTEQWGKLTVPMEGLAGVLFSSAGMPAYSDSLDWFRRNSDLTDDRLLLTNGDVIRGFVAGVSKEGVRLELGDDVNTVPLRLAVAARLVHPPVQAPQGRYAVVSLSDGQRLTVVELEWSHGKIKARADGGESVEPPTDQVRSISFHGGRWEWLSAKSPSRAEHVPMLAMEWRHVSDRNVLGGPLRVAGESYDRGVGVHSKSVLTYALDAGYKELVTSFGMDDNSGRRANGQVAILVDGRQRFERSNVIAGVLHGPVRVDLSGASRLELVVDFGLNGDIQDRFDWIEPGLVKPGG